MLKRNLTVLATLTVVACMPINCFAAEYYLEDGNISIHSDGTSQTVTQSENTIEDLNPLIKNREPGTATNNTIEISSDQGAVADVTIEDVNIFVPQGEEGSGIDVKGDSEALITVKGENFVENANGESAVHVADGALGITGDGTLNAKTHGTLNSDETMLLEGAAIGTNSHEDLNGSITIGGNSKNNASVGSQDFEHEGAAIGTGCGGDITKDAMISVIGQAVVDAKTDDDGAGIGSGADGDIDGSVIIKDNAKVKASSNYDGAGIGTGERGSLGEDGLICITGKANVNGITEDDGAGIGVGRKGDFYGKILIDGESHVEASSDSEGAAIGAGEDTEGYESSQIIIGGKAVVVAKAKRYSTGIGTGDESSFAGDIIIQDEADVTSIGTGSAAAIGADNVGDMTGSIQILGKSKVTTGARFGAEIIFDSSTPGIIGTGGYRETKKDNIKYVIGSGVTINGIKADSEENLAKILDVYTKASSTENVTQEEKPIDLQKFEPKLEQAKLPSSNIKPAEDPVKPETKPDVKPTISQVKLLNTTLEQPAEPTSKTPTSVMTNGAAWLGLAGLSATLGSILTFKKRNSK